MSDATARSPRRIVVKVGTNTLCDRSGALDTAVLAALAADVAALRAAGHQVLLVSSGAIGLGRDALGLAEPPQDIRVRQACAAIGQHRLVAAWQDALTTAHAATATDPADAGSGSAAQPDSSPPLVAQMLLTHHTFQSRRSYLNLRHCMEATLAGGAIPLINENDAVSIEEIDASFGDNDRLAALVAGKMEADLLVLLSDVDGLYDGHPGHPATKRIAVVEHIDDDVLAWAKGDAGTGARGGMKSKLRNARLATDFGIPVHLAGGRTPGIVQAVVAGDDVGTRFTATGRRDGKKRWLQTTRAEGSIAIDDGAAAALRGGANLLPAGVAGVAGSFDVESAVNLVTTDGTIVARAVSCFSSDDLLAIGGLQGDDAAARLGLESGSSVNVTRKGGVVLFES